MKKSILILPVGGTASRMLGIPKFMLPVNPQQTLIEKHCSGAFLAGYEEVHVITRAKYYGIVSDFFSEKNNAVQVHALPFETKTMCESLVLGTKGIPEIREKLVTIGLADTAFRCSDYTEIYSSIRNEVSEFVLGLFPIREDQFGKLGQVMIDQDLNVISMRDKDVNCTWPNIWGLAKLPGVFIADLEPSDSHIGISIEKLILNGQKVKATYSEVDYYDCGTFNEYKKLINI